MLVTSVGVLFSTNYIIIVTEKDLCLASAVGVRCFWHSFQWPASSCLVS